MLVDAPCSGTGTWRRNPETRWRAAPARLARLTALQARLLDLAGTLVRPGGILVYAVCSLLAEEGRDQAAAFTARSGLPADIVPVKAGRTAEGGRAAASHTGALAGQDAAVDALLEQTGVLRVDSVQEMFGVAQALVTQPLPKGGRVALLTNAGGPAILATDYLVAKGLTLARLSDATQAAPSHREPSGQAATHWSPSG